MLDEFNPQIDLNKASFVLNKSCIKQSIDNFSASLWSNEQLTDYINFIQKVLEPCVTEEAEAMLKAYY